MKQQLSSRLRKLKVLSGPYKSFDVCNLPSHPVELFLSWLNQAIESNEIEPHAMTLSTVDHEGFPDARVLILKNVQDNQFYFASSSESRKGEQLKFNPLAALTFYWPTLGKQIRIRGTVQQMGTEVNAEDFLARSIGARAIALTGKQSKALIEGENIEDTIQEMKKKIEQNPDVVSPDWTLYSVSAKEIEFWQGDEERKHTRIQYTFQEDKWVIKQLWP